MDKKEFTEQLTAFGITAIEAKIYLHLLEKPPKSILEIARELDLPRTSIYDNSLKLAEKGLVQRIVTFKSQKLQAYPLTILQELIDKERSRIDALQDNLTSLQERLRHSFISPGNTEVRFYQGMKGFQQMMWNALSAHETMCGYSQFGRAEVVGEKFAKHHAEEMVKRNIRDRVLTNPTPEIFTYLKVDPIKDERRVIQTTRVLDTSRLYISGDTSIYNTIFAVTYWKQGEIVGVEMENAELVKTQKSIFEELWKLADPIEKYIKK